MTLEPSLPYVSIGCAIGAGVAAAAGSSPGLRRALKAAALFALAVFAFLRGIGPAAIAFALVLSALGWATTPREPARRSVASTGLFILAWLTLAYLCLRAGGGVDALLAPTRLALALLTVVGLAGLIVWSRRFPDGRPSAWLAETLALGLVLVSSLTLRDDQWPAMTGALALVCVQAVRLAVDSQPQPRLARAAEVLTWLASYLGQAAMAYAFLR